MKIKKKAAMAITFSLGALLFASTALADIATKSGYEQLKDSLKKTSYHLAHEFDSYTIDTSAVIKDNGNIIYSENSVQKTDVKAGAEITKNDHFEDGRTSSSLWYEDKTTFIYKNSIDDTYNVTNFTSERETALYQDLFEEEEAKDIEKIVDALVGSLKDQVAVTENSDGSKEIQGSLNEVQIPALVNAVVSFAVKQEFNGVGNYDLSLTEDVFVKRVEGKAVVNKDGILESILGSVVLSGKDKGGQLHEVSLELMAKLYDINNTSVQKPDLTGKNVITETVDRDYYGHAMRNPEKFVGKFVNDVIMEENGKFVKVGERFIEIEQIDGKTVKGRYYEVFKPGYENYTLITDEFEFTANFEQNDPYNAYFDESTKSTVNVDGIYFDDYRANLYLSADHHVEANLSVDGEFRMILD